jgi:hypothetical protein
MNKTVFGQAVTANDVERLPADTGPTDFIRLCGALIGKALAERAGSFTLPEISERINVPDGGIDAEYTTPENLSLPETGGLVGPGITIFQFKYRDATSASGPETIRKIVQEISKDFPRTAQRCDRYVFMTNILLSGAHLRRIRDALIESYPAFASKQIVIRGAAEIALTLNVTPDLRHLFFPEAGLRPLDTAEAEPKREDREEWIWDYRIRRSELETMVRQKNSPERLWAIARLLKDAPRERVLELLTPDEILEALPRLDEHTRERWEAYARHWSAPH